MLLEGSCHCGAVHFSLQSRHPYPFNVCYCSICRKTAGGGGCAINLSGDYQTMKVNGREHLRVYNAILERDQKGQPRESEGQRNFCGECGSALWLWDPRWPELVHPFASAIDTDLPTPPERTHLMLASRARWVSVCNAPGDHLYDEYPEESIAAWHQRLNLESN